MNPTITSKEKKQQEQQQQDSTAIKMSALTFLSSLTNSKSTMDMLSQAAMGSDIPPIPSADTGTAKGTDSSDFCNQLPEPLQSYAQTILNATSTDEESTNAAAVAVARVDAYEVSVKTHLQSLTQTLLTSNAQQDAASVEEALEELLRFGRGVIDFALHVCHTHSSKPKLGQDGIKIDASPQFQKIPFLVLEDLVDTLPISLLQIIWSLHNGPSVWLTDLLCPTELFTKNQGSKYVLIRLCNRLLSKAGSGLSSLTFSSSSVSVSTEHDNDLVRGSGFGFAGNVNRLLARVFPLSERSAVNVLGNFHVDRTILFESEEEFQIQQQGGMDMNTITTSSGGGSHTHGDYDLYQTFWSLQNSFTTPAKLLPKPLTLAEKRAVSSGTAAPILYDASAMEQFLKQMEVVLDAFQSHSFDKELKTVLEARVLDEADRGTEDVIHVLGVETPVQTNIQMDDNDNVDPPVEPMEIDGMPTKSTAPIAMRNSSNPKRYYQYLTNSQLLPLQLQDPELRIQFITQFFLIASYIQSSITAYSSTPAAALSHTNRDKCKSVLFNLSLLLKRAGKAMEAIPPNGKEHKMALEWTLNEREIIWKTWKKQKCAPPIEKVESASGKQDNQNSLSGKEATAARKSKSNRYCGDINITEELPTLSQTLARTNTPNVDEYFEEYVDALDPEAGIEAEYHPKNDVLFCWRAMRLLAKDHVGRFPDEAGGSEVNNDDGNGTEEAMISKCMVKKSNGDFEGMIRTLWKEDKNIDIPGEMPSVEDTNHDLVVEEEEEEMDQEEVDGKGENESMEEAETKKEVEASKQSKFNKLESEVSKEASKEEESAEKINSKDVIDAITEKPETLPSQDTQKEEKVVTELDQKIVKESDQDGDEAINASGPGELSKSEAKKDHINEPDEQTTPSSDSSSVTKKAKQEMDEARRSDTVSENGDDAKAKGENKNEGKVKEELKPSESQDSKKDEKMSMSSSNKKPNKGGKEDNDIQVKLELEEKDRSGSMPGQSKKRKADDVEGEQVQNGSSRRKDGYREHGGNYHRNSKETADKEGTEDGFKGGGRRRNVKKDDRRDRSRRDEGKRSRDRDKDRKNEVTADEKKGSNSNDKNDDVIQKSDYRDAGYRRGRGDRNRDIDRRDNKGKDDYHRGGQRGGTSNNATQQQSQQDQMGQNQGRGRQNGGGQGRRGSHFIAPARGGEHSPPPPPPPAPHNQQQQGRDGGVTGGRRNDGRHNNGSGNDRHQNKRNWADGGGGRDRNHNRQGGGRDNRRRKY